MIRHGARVLRIQPFLESLVLGTSTLIGGSEEVGGCLQLISMRTAEEIRESKVQRHTLSHNILLETENSFHENNETFAELYIRGREFARSAKLLAQSV